MPKGNAGTTPLQDEFIEWLVDPEREGSETSWARAHNIGQPNCSKWKQDARFRKAWEKRLAELNINPDRIQKVVNAIYKAATERGDVKAASLYLQYIERFVPTQKVVTEERASDLSDEDLAKELEEGARHLRAV